MKARILIVDDEPQIRDMLSRHFRFINYDVTTAANGHETLEHMKSNVYDIVISDISMPEMIGVDLLRKIKAQYPMVHVIMITGYVVMENVLACMRHGADTCVFKPFEDLSELETAVKRALDDLTRWQEKLKQLRKMRPDDSKQ